MTTFDNVIYPVADIESAKAIHRALLATEPHTDQPEYVGFNVDGVEIGLIPLSLDGPSAPIAHVRVPDIRMALNETQEAGATLVSEPRDVGGGTFVATIKDADGTLLGLVQRG